MGKQRLNEIDVDVCVAACEAMAGLLAHCGCNQSADKQTAVVSQTGREATVQRRNMVICGIDQKFWGDREFGPMLSLALQRLAGMPIPLLKRLEHAVARLNEHVKL